MTRPAAKDDAACEQRSSNANTPLPPNPNATLRPASSTTLTFAGTSSPTGRTGMNASAMSSFSKDSRTFQNETNRIDVIS